MSSNVRKKIVLVLILVLNSIFIDNVSLTFCVNALEVGQKIDDVQSEQRNKDKEENGKVEESKNQVLSSQSTDFHNFKYVRAKTEKPATIRLEDDKTESPTFQTNPTVISSSRVFEELNERDLQNLRMIQNRTKDTLLLKHIEKDASFNWPDENVLEWKHLRHNEQNYYLGRCLNEVLVVLHDKTLDVIKINYTIQSLETHTYWNFEEERQEGIILVATEKQVLWFKHFVNQKFELFTKWTLNDYINQMVHLSVNSEDYIFLCYNESYVDVFNFDIKTKNVKLAQSIDLETPCDDIALLKTGLEVILAIPQNNKILIYVFKHQEALDEPLKFHFKELIATENFHSLRAFRITDKNYLALSGSQPKIFLYRDGSFEPIVVFDESFGFVDLFLPIPVKGYRDDMILLLQYNYNNFTSIEALVWNGESFSSNLPVFCLKNSQKLAVQDCLLNNNLKGAMAVSTHKAQVSLIVPSVEGKSQLLHFHSEIMARNSELLNLQEAFEFFKAWVHMRDEMVAQALLFLDMPEDVLCQQMLNQIPTVEHLKTPEFQFNGDVEEIFLNDYKWSPQDSAVDLNALLDSVQNLENSVVPSRQRRELENVYQELHLDSLQVDELEIENLNGQTFYIQNGVLNFPGEFLVSELEVLDRVLAPQKRQLSEDIELDGDLEFDYINDLKWDELMKNLVSRNEEQELESLLVEGDIVVEDVLKIQTLNTLAFPDDYLVANGPRSSIVKAEKYFNNTLSANSVDTDGFINGQNPVEAISLNDGQEWLGSAVFNQLEVTEILELNGTVHGRNVDNVPANPTLLESNIIEASCVFNDLEVHGPIVLKGNLDGQPLGELLQDILQKPEDPREEILVTSAKSFSSITLPLDFELEENRINEIPTEKFVTLHTPQTLEVSSLEGYVYFYNLTLQGLYDGINIENVLREVIRLDKPLDLSTTQLIFEEELQAENLIILERINNLSIKDNLQLLNEDLHIQNAEFEHLQATTVEFIQDIVGPGKLNNIELHDFVTDRSWHAPPIQGNLFLNELRAAQGLQADELHGINAEILLDFLKNIEDMPEMVLNGQIQVDHIMVTGDVQAQKLNGQLFDEDIQMTAIWLNRANHLTPTISFKNPLDIQGNLIIQGKYQELNMPEFMADIVMRNYNESFASIKAPKHFLKPVYVLRNTQVKALNGVPFDNIALKTKENHFPGTVKVKGKLITPHLEVQGQVNGAGLKDMEDILYYDPQWQNFVLKGEVRFENPIAVEDLTVMGDFNELRNLSDFFSQVIYKSGPCRLQGQNNFTGRVSIEQGAFIGQLNNLNVENLFQQLIFIKGTEPVIITSPLLFEDAVKFNQISIHKSLKTRLLSGCSVAEWLNDTLRANEDHYIPYYLQFSPGALDGNSLKAHFINNLNLSRIVTLNTPQEFEETVQFSDVYLQGSIQVNGSVNDLDLQEEYNNTLMIYGDQHIITPLTIESILVLQDLQILGLVNGNKNLSDVALLGEDLQIQSPIYFKSLYSPHLIANDLVTGIELDKWLQSAVKSQSQEKQYITGNWSARLLTVKQGPNQFQYAINGYQPWQYNSYIRYPRSYSDAEREELCEMLKSLWKKIEQKSVMVKYLEESFVMEFESSKNVSRKIFHMNYGLKNYMLLNEHCVSHIYLWNPVNGNFTHHLTYESGPIAQIVVITPRNSEQLEFITNYENTEPLNCSISKGVNVWSSKDDTIINERTYLEEVSDISIANNRDLSLLVLAKDVVKEIDLRSFETLNKWRYPFKQRKYSRNLRFLKSESEDEAGILITNGLEIVSLGQTIEEKNSKIKKDIINLFMPSFFQIPSWLGYQEYETISMLKPNRAIVRKLALSDFKQVLERILLDLSEKLNQEINITQLSIPESDLFDEYLIPDFVAIMEQLQKQKLLTKEQLNLNYGDISLPATPAQVLAGHVLQIVWPVVEELEEMHGLLKDNESHNHLLCDQIKRSLGSVMGDVLREAFPRQSKGQSQELHGVIERIREFDRELHTYVEILNKKSEDNMEMSASNRTDRIFKTKHNYTQNADSYASRRGEILRLEVGSITKPRSLVATTSFMTPDHDSGIYICGDGDISHGKPFQVINVQNPHSLMELRVKQETLLIFIENCCEVQVWRYKGTQGFIKFATIPSDMSVQQILTMPLPNEDGNPRYYLGLLLPNKLKFYEILVQGISRQPPTLPCA
uniref:VWFD domain-containing protein n=1 Tax=Stomoxys calcitrans TaxID=35570 RepID=A0A1I8PQ83_STOCA